MNIVDAYIKHHEKEGFDPELMIVVDGQLPCDDDAGWNWDELFDEASNTTIYHAQRSDGLIRVYWGTAFDLPEPYYSTVKVNGEKKTVKNPAASSCPVLNWLEIGPCINVTFVNKDNKPLALNYYTNITINKCIQIIDTFLPNIRLSRMDQGELEEIPYVLEYSDAEIKDNETIIYPEHYNETN